MAWNLTWASRKRSCSSRVSWMAKERRSFASAISSRRERTVSPRSSRIAGDNINLYSYSIAELFAEVEPAPPSAPVNEEVRNMPKKPTPPNKNVAKPELVKTPSPPAPMESPNGSNCTIVGFGASAGGMEAFTEVLANMPKDSGLALVLVQHLDPNHQSVLTELLGRTTPLPVFEIQDGMLPEPNHVYVIPPNATLTMEDGLLRLGERGWGQPMPIDIFLKSLAEDQGSKAIGVILSGTASDGTLGLKAIKAEGGITFCQDPGSSKYDGMPRSAIAAGCVDLVLTPRAIAAELVRLCKHPYVADGHPPEIPEQPEPNFNEILSVLRSVTGVDFTFYKNATIRRRILRRM